MKIIGTGVDLVEVPRFRQSVKRWGGRMLSRLFTPAELSYCRSYKDPHEHLAVRFAAKEAVVKAIGAPKGLALEWKDLEIVRASSGQPGVRFKGSMIRWKKLKVHLSLSHTKQYAVASAVVCKQ
jgi:phosphopantetheine--protein transferase-like protein